MKGRHRYVEALATAEKLRARLGPFCERIEIAGSLRRRCETVGDIELVAVPKQRAIEGLFGQVQIEGTWLDDHLEKYPDIYRQMRSGERMKELMFEGYQVDLFLTTPERWGVTFTLRTGSADFSKWLVSPRTAGGARLPYRFVKDCRVWEWGKSAPLATPEEADVFVALGVPWVPLEKRDRGYWSGTPHPASPLEGRGEEDKARDYV